MTKKQKPSYSAHYRKYSTKQIMEITQQRRLKQEAAAHESQLETAKQEADLTANELNVSASVAKEVNEFVGQVNIRPPQETLEQEVVPKENPLQQQPEPVAVAERFTRPQAPPKAIAKNIISDFFIFILSMPVFYLVLTLELPVSWVAGVQAKLNGVVAYGGFLLLSLLGERCSVQGVVLNGQYHSISLQTDRIAFYSLGLILVFALFYAFLQRTTWVKKTVIFLSIFPLALFANILRVCISLGIASNYGPAVAHQYFQGVLAVLVFVFIIGGLIFFKLLLCERTVGYQQRRSL